MFGWRRKPNFSDTAIEMLEKSGPNFDFKQIAEFGIDNGFLSPKEADVLATKSEFPNRFAEEIADKTENSPISDDNAHTNLELYESVNFDIKSARTAPGTRLPQRFGKKAVQAPAISLIRGEKARHHLLNFQKLSWSDMGIIQPLSNSSSHLLRPFLENCDPLNITGRTFLGVVEGSSIYTHWLLDTFPKLLLYLESGGELSDIDSFIFATINSSFHKYALGEIGVDVEKVYTRQKHGTYIYTDEYIYITPTRRNTIAAGGIYEKVREFYLGPESKLNQRGRRIYISREKANRRRILNEDELRHCLQKHEFEYLTLESFNISEAARIIREASHIIAPHGAGLANLVFACSNTKVLEIFGAHLSADYWSICEQLNLEYHAYEALDPRGHRISKEAIERMGFHERNGYDMFVDIQSFDKFLSSVFMT